MHLGNGTVTPTCVLIGAGVATAGIAAGWRLVRDSRRPDPRSFATAAAAIFVLQACNVTVLPGVSGHLVGGFALGYWFGPLWGPVAMALVLAVQATLFADGGWMALGLNVLNMGVIPALLAYPLFKGLLSGWRIPAAMAGAWLSVVIASLVCALAIPTGAAGLTELAGSLVGVHAVIGMFEALMTAVLLLAAMRLKGMSPVASAGWTAAATGVAAVVATTYASPWPDGLEHTLGTLSVPQSASAVSAWFAQIQPALAPFADYTLPGLLAGLVVVAAVAAMIPSLGRKA